MSILEVITGLTTLVEMGVATPAQEALYLTIVTLMGTSIALMGLGAYTAIRNRFAKVAA